MTSTSRLSRRAAGRGRSPSNSRGSRLPAEQLRRGAVHAHAEGEPAVQPPSGVADHLVGHRLGQREHQPRAARVGQEVEREQEPLGRVLPAHQGLDAGDPPGDRRRPAAGTRRRAGPRRCPGAGPRPAAAGAGRSRRATRRTGGCRSATPWPRTSRRPHDAAGRSPGASSDALDRDADRRPDRELQALDAQRLEEHQAQPLGELEQGDLVALPDEDGELVAAEPRHRQVGPDEAPHPVGGGLEHRVAGRVAEAVVDVLEPVEVEQHEGQRPTVLQAHARGPAARHAGSGSPVSSSVRDSRSASAAPCASRRASTSRQPAAMRVTRAGTVTYQASDAARDGRRAPPRRSSPHRRRVPDRCRRTERDRDVGTPRARGRGDEDERGAVEDVDDDVGDVGLLVQVEGQAGVGDGQRDEAERRGSTSSATGRAAGAPPGPSTTVASTRSISG